MKNWLASFIMTFVLLASILTTASAQSATSLTINNILVTPKPEKVAYEVKAYLSVLDSTGIPIKNLKPENFSVVEDAKPIAIDSLTTANDPMSLLLVLDTSGSMGGTPIKSARDAANNLLLGLSNDDEVSILSFNNTVNPVIDFTQDRQTAGQKLSSIEAVPNSGTCLYNAAYQAIQNVAVLPPGRRAIVLFTDGVDEAANGNGKPCSTYTLDDVIDLAIQGNVRIPIYTLGLGSRVDQQSLQRLAALTGGQFQYVPTSDQLGAIFNNLSNQLKSQYLLQYLTTAAQGSHTMVIQATTPGGSAKDTRNFISPEMPPGILIKSPTEGQAISGKQTIAATFTGQTQGVEKVKFYVGGKEVGESTTSPYEINFEFTSSFAGSTSISVVALGANGVEIARQNVNVTVLAPTSIPAATSAPLLTPTAGSSSSKVANSASSFFMDNKFIIAGGVILLLAIVVFTVFMLRRKRSKIVVSGSNFGELEVLYSDDKTFIKKQFEIHQPVTKLGRLIGDNDIAFPEDKAVSRQHATLENKGGELYLSEVSKGTKFGTFIGDQKIGTAPVLLHNGDVIRLGSRLQLKITVPMGEQTIDQIDVSTLKEEKTFDHILPPTEPYHPFNTQDPE